MGQLNRVSANGLNYGFPYCHANGVIDPDVKKYKACDGITMPAAEMGAHAASMGVMFYSGSMFPADYRKQMLVVRKGSWNRTADARRLGADQRRTDGCDPPCQLQGALIGRC